MKIVLAQLNYHIGNFEYNVEIAKNAIAKAKSMGGDIVLFSELSVSGYYPHDQLERRSFMEQSKVAIEKIAEECYGIVAIIGAPTENLSDRGKPLMNSAVVIEEGKVVFQQNKTLLPTYDIFDEYRHFEPNRNFKLFEFKGKKIAITICEDLWEEQPTVSEYLRSKLYNIDPLEELSKSNPDFVLNLSASPFSANQSQDREDVLIRNAKRYNLPIVYVNQVGANTEIVFDGGSMVVDGNGVVVDRLSSFEEEIKMVDLDSLSTSEIDSEEIDRIETIKRALILGMRDYFKKMGFKKATLGLSGGIDSALTAALAVDALGAENVVGVLMPSKFSSDHSIKDAYDLAKNLGIEAHMLKINDVVDNFESTLQPLFEGCDQDVTEENIQARSRGVLMMALSNKFGYILLNTSNKSEVAVGYSTLYGDMNGGLSVLGDLYKSDVFKMSKSYNREKAIIPVNTIVKPPSAELRPDQKDSDSLPEYDILDGILYMYIEGGASVDDILSKGYKKDDVDRVVGLVDRNEYKRFQSPPIIRISSKSFGFGRNMPLVAKYH